MYQGNQAVYGLCQCCLGSDVVLWNTEYCPPSISKLSRDSQVPFSIGVYLVYPEFTAQALVFTALRAPVPEAPVNKDHYPLSREYHVGVSGELQASDGLVSIMGEVPYASMPQSRS